MVALLSFITQGVQGKTYTIIRLNTPSIEVGDSRLHVGDSFDESAKIKWEKPGQVMKVIDEDRRQILLCSNALRQGCSVKEYLLSVKSMSTRGGQLMSIDDHREFFGSPIVVWDPVIIESVWPESDNEYFEVTIKSDGSEKTARLPVGDEGYPVITSEIFGCAPGLSEVLVDVRYVSEGEEIILAENLKIWYLNPSD